MKKIIKTLIIILSIIILTSCESHKEISDLGMVSAMGIEKKDGEFFISVQVANIKKSTNMGTNNASKVTLFTGNGKTSFEAIREITNKSSKKLYFSHIKLIILSDEIINEDPYQMIDFYSRDNEGNMNAYILVAKENTPYEILSTVTAFEDVPAEYIYNSLELSSVNYGNTYILRFEDYVNNLIKDGIDPSFTKISLTSNNEEKNNTDELNSIKLSSYIKLGNILVFNQNKKLVELTKEESESFNLIKQKKLNNTLTLKCDDKNYTTLETMNNSSDISFDYDKNIVNINLNITYSISEFNCNKSLLNKKDIESIKKNIEKEITKNVENLLNKSKEYNSDFIGFGSMIKSKNKNYFNFKNNNWQKEGLTKLNFKIKTKINLENRGDLINIIKKEGNHEKQN